MKQIQTFHRALTLCNKIMEDEESCDSSLERPSELDLHISEEGPGFSVSDSSPGAE